MLFLYQPLIENARFCRLFCFNLMLFMLAVLAYLASLAQIEGLWLIVLGCAITACVYFIYLCRLSDEEILAKAARWIELNNQKFQQSAYGIQADAVFMLLLIFPFVICTWLIYYAISLLNFK